MLLSLVINQIEPPYTLIKPSVSIDEFFELTNEDSNAELISGELIMHSPATLKHEDLFDFLHFLLRGLCFSKKNGQNLGFTLYGKTYRGRYI